MHKEYGFANVIISIKNCN